MAQVVDEFHGASAGVADDGAGARHVVDPVNRIPVERFGEHTRLAACDHDGRRDHACDQATHDGCCVFLHERLA
jgi:hypothetical protein